MDAGVAALDHRRGAGVSSKAQMRNKLLQSDIGDIDITKEQPIKKQGRNSIPDLEQGPPVVPIQAQQYNPSQYGYPSPYQQQQRYQQQQFQPPQHQPRPQYNYPEEGSRKSSMSSSTATFSNFFKGKYKKLNNKRASGYDEKADDDDNTDFADHDSSFLTFSDISSMRNNGGHAYGYGGHQDDTSPIVPTLVTSGNTGSMNSTEYRKVMMNQKKMTLNSLARQQQQQLQQQQQGQQFGPPGPGGPRTMSLQSFHQRPMGRPGGPGAMMGPGGIQQPRTGMPPNGTRFNSLMSGGPSPMANRSGYPPQQVPPSDPRAMSLTADRRLPVAMNGNPQFRNGYQGQYVASPVGQRTPGAPGQYNGPIPQGGPPVAAGPQFGPNYGPRAMSLQTQPPSNPLYRQEQRASGDNGFDNKEAIRSLAPPPQQLSNKGTSGSSSSYASVNSVISEMTSEHSSPTTPSNTSSDETNQVPSLPRSPLKYQLHATLSNEDVDTEKGNGFHSFNEEDEDQQTYSDSKDDSHNDDAFDSDPVVKLNILTLSEPARQELQMDEQNTENGYIQGTKSSTSGPDSQADGINIRASSALTSNISTEAYPTSKIQTVDQDNKVQPVATKHSEVSSVVKSEMRSQNGDLLQSKRSSRVESSGEKDLRKSSSGFQMAKNFLMKIKRTKSNDLKPLSTLPSPSGSNRNSVRSSTIADESDLPQHDTFRRKSSVSSDRRRMSYHSLFSASSAGNQLDHLSNSKDKTFDRSSTMLQIRKSMIIGESTEIQEEPTLEQETVQRVKPTAGVPYKPSYASEKEPQQPVLITEENLNILGQNNNLMKELQLVSTELAESIAREARLENELESKSPKETDSPQALSLLDFETELRKKSSKIVELIQQLNEERLKRFIAEEQNLLYQHGTKSSPNELVFKIHELQTQLQSKNQIIEQLQSQTETSI